MKTRSFAQLAGAAALILFAVAAGPPPAHAQDWGMGMGMMGGGQGHMMGRGGMGMGALFQYTDQARIDALKASLAIRPEQEDAWGTYAKALQGAASTMQSLHQSMDPAVIRAMTPVDRQSLMTQMRTQRQDAWQSLSTAGTTLFAALDDKQKATAGQSLPGLAGCPGMGGQGMGRW